MQSKSLRREESIDHQIKTTWHAIARMYNQEAAKYGITMSIGFVLINIDKSEGTPATKIAPLMGLEARSLTRILKNMEERKLIYRQTDENDRRSVRIFLTAEGLQKREVSKKVIKEFNERMSKAIAPEKLEAFFDVITKVRLAANSSIA